MVHPFQEKRSRKTSKNPKSNKDTTVPLEKRRVYGIDHLSLGEPAVNCKVTSNDSLRTLGKSIWQTNDIEIIVLNMNVTYHLIFLAPQNAQKIKIVITHQSYRAV